MVVAAIAALASGCTSQPPTLAYFDTTKGGTVAGNVLGRIDAWQHILAMLARLR